MNDMRWRWPSADFPTLIKIKASPDFLPQGGKDNINWIPYPKVVFSIRSTRNEIKVKKHIMDQGGLIQVKKHTPRHSFMTWLTVKEELMTKDKLLRFNNTLVDTCSLCNKEKEDFDLLFFNCGVSHDIWSHNMRLCNHRYMP